MVITSASHAHDRLIVAFKCPSPAMRQRIKLKSFVVVQYFFDMKTTFDFPNVQAFEVYLRNNHKNRNKGEILYGFLLSTFEQLIIAGDQRTFRNIFLVQLKIERIKCVFVNSADY